VNAHKNEEMSCKPCNSIDVKEIYIGTGFISTALSGFVVAILSFLLFLILFAYIVTTATNGSMNVWMSLVFLFLAFLGAYFVSYPLFNADELLRRRCGKWNYDQFHRLERISVRASIPLYIYDVLFFVLLYLGQVSLPAWSLLLTWVLTILLAYFVVFSRIFSKIGRAAMLLRRCLRGWRTGSDRNFKELNAAAIAISKFARGSNMKLVPENLSLGMTISLVDKWDSTQQDFDDLIEWVEDQIDKKKFWKFRLVIRKYDQIAEIHSKIGIEPKSGRTFGDVARYVLAPVVVLVLYSVLQGLWTYFSTRAG
jgi:hypothetical protein